MQGRWRRSVAWVLAWLALAAFVGVALVRWDIAQRREAFHADARIVHRLLSQRVIEVDAILSTLSLLDAQRDMPHDGAERLPALHPPVLRVLRREADGAWPDPALEGAMRDAEARSRHERRSMLAVVDPVDQRYVLVLAGHPRSHALVIDVSRLVPWDTWPLPRDGPVRVRLRHADAVMTLQPGADVAASPAGLTPGFVFAKTLDSPSQPFEVQVRRATGPAQWPWVLLMGWAVASAAGMLSLWAWQRQRVARQHAEDLLRLGQTARLNTLGEMAAGIAHELNQPLTAVLANVQAARRHLQDVGAGVVGDRGAAHAAMVDEELAAAGDALAQAAAQARRVADVVQRVRRSVERPSATTSMRPVALDALARDAVRLIEPEARRRGVRLSLSVTDVAVEADPVALEQILHNLLLNALQAFDAPTASRAPCVDVAVTTHDGQGVLTVGDNGPGIAAAMLPRLFQPFSSSKRGGLGLGLSLSETLASGMGGRLSARNREGGGAEFRMTLPLAGTVGDAR